MAASPSLTESSRPGRGARGIACSLVRPSVRAQGDPLPSWNDGAAKQAIVDFVAR